MIFLSLHRYPCTPRLYDFQNNMATPWSGRGTTSDFFFFSTADIPRRYFDNGLRSFYLPITCDGNDTGVRRDLHDKTSTWGGRWLEGASECYSWTCGVHGWRPALGFVLFGVRDSTRNNKVRTWTRGECYGLACPIPLKGGGGEKYMIDGCPPYWTTKHTGWGHDLL